MSGQLEFDLSHIGFIDPTGARILRKEEIYGQMDGASGLGLVSHYSSQLTGLRREAYHRGWLNGRNQLLAIAIVEPPEALLRKRKTT